MLYFTPVQNRSQGRTWIANVIATVGVEYSFISSTNTSIPAGTLRSYGMAGQAKVLDGYIYVADGYSGLTVLKLDTN